METTGNSAEGGEGARTSVRTPPARPRIRCPHCRAVDPPIDYGELAYYEQSYLPDTEDWAGNGELGETDGTATIVAKCSRCDGDITTYLIRWSARNPDHEPYAGFAHEVHIPRGLPLPRNARQFLADREWCHGRNYQGTHKQPLDWELQAAIDAHRRELGLLLDEREERQRRERGSRSGRR